MFQVHRNHVALPWPVDSPTLTKHCVSIAVDITDYELDNSDSLIARFGKLTGHTCESLTDLTSMLNEEHDLTGSNHLEETGSQKTLVGTLS